MILGKVLGVLRASVICKHCFFSGSDACSGWLMFSFAMGGAALAFVLAQKANSVTGQQGTPGERFRLWLGAQLEQHVLVGPEGGLGV